MPFPTSRRDSREVLRSNKQIILVLPHSKERGGSVQAEAQQKRPTVFISYAHESAALRLSVKALADWLGNHGCSVRRSKSSGCGGLASTRW